MVQFVRFVLLLIVLSVVSCRKGKPVEEYEGAQNIVLELQERAGKTSLDSSFIFLTESGQLLNKFSKLPDSLRAKNEYLLGVYFEGNNLLDSAAIHYDNATLYVTAPLKLPRDVSYFRKAWGIRLLLEDYGNGFAIRDRFFSLLDSADYQNRALAHNFSENAYRSLGDIEKALNSLESGMKAYKQLQDTSNFARKKLDWSYLQYLYFANKTEARRILDSLVAVSDRLSTNVKAQLFEKYGIVCFYENDFPQSLAYYLKGLAEIKNIPGIDVRRKKQRLGSMYANIAEVYIELNEYNRSRNYADSVFLLGMENVTPSTYENTLKYLLKLDYITGDGLKSLLDSQDSIRSFQNRIHKQKIDKELLELNRANQREKQLLINRQELKLSNLALKQKQYWLWTALGVLALLIVIGVLFYRQRKIRSETQVLLMQQRLLRAQMNPHFTLNTLTAIQHLLKGNTERATDYLVKFSRLLGLIFKNSMHSYIPLRDELESIMNYLELQSLRYPSRFSFDVQTDRVPNVAIPPMLIQPFVENSIQHGFEDTTAKGKVVVRVSLLENLLLCEVEDNGRGMDFATHGSREGSTALIAEFLKRTTGKEIEYTNKGSGLIVRLYIPYKTRMDDKGTNH